MLGTRIRELVADVDASYEPPDHKGFPGNLPTPTEDGLPIPEPSAQVEYVEVAAAP